MYHFDFNPNLEPDAEASAHQAELFRHLSQLSTDQQVERLSQVRELLAEANRQIDQYWERSTSSERFHMRVNAQSLREELNFLIEAVANAER